MFSHTETIWERQHALLFRHGAFQRVLDSGRHKLPGKGWQVQTYPKMNQSQALANQDVMTKDGASLRLTVIVTFNIADPVLYFKSGGAGPERAILSESPENQVLLQAQVGLRDWASTRDLEEAIADRDKLGPALQAILEPAMSAVGLKFVVIYTRDVVIGGALRTAYSDLLKAKLEAQSALERARGESATMRSLLNTARLVRENPGLLELRILSSGQKPRLSFVVQSGAMAQPAAEAEAVAE
jgi:regulator of protease activity HflC (stomatin/prohibitin superfamily)